jgi:RNA polymerase sigma factor (sigma-70 family)
MVSGVETKLVASDAGKLLSMDQLHEMLLRCIQGDAEAWRMFSLQYHRLITGTAVRFGSRDYADDIVQSVYVKLLENECQILRSFSGPEAAFLIFLKNVAKNVARNFMRSTGRHEGHEILMPGLPEIFSAESEGSERLDLAEEVYEAILDLRLPYRTVLHFRYCGYNHREIGQMLGVPLNTVLTQSNRGISLLKKRFKVK